MGVHSVRQQLHGYRNGHQLLDGVALPDRQDQDLIDRLSDIAGSSRPGEVFPPYLTVYPLPSGAFHVLARTWQDLKAPRAGCVLTRSLLIPVATWAEMASIASLARSIDRPKIEDLETSPRAPVRAQTVTDPRLPEIVEALFLEGRRPVVVFDAPQAEAISLRLLDALWPARRTTFSVCTWCLTPRRIGGRDFDLAFAPSDARLRFSDWSGRRIDPSTRPASPRHRWTTQLVDEIFGHTQGTLNADDRLGMLTGEQGQDEAALRLSLLWRELESKAPSTPNAVLGMLDIVNSREILRHAVWPRLEPLAAQAVRQAASSFDPDDAWRFFVNLLGKYPVKLPGSATLRQIRSMSQKLAHDRPSEVFDFLGDLGLRDQALPAILAAGIGDGLPLAVLETQAYRVREQVRGDRLLALLAYSRRFGAAFAEAAKGTPVLVDAVAEAFRIGHPPLANRARRNLLPHLQTSGHAVLLPALLANTSPIFMRQVVRALARHTRFAIKAFDEPLIAAAGNPAVMQALRDAVLEADCGGEEDRLLRAILTATPEDLQWILDHITGSRASTLIADLLREAPDTAIQSAVRDGKLAERLVDRLGDEPRTFALPLLRLLLAMPDSPQFLGRAATLYPLLHPTDRAPLAAAMLRRGLVRSPASGSLDLATVLADASGQLNADQLVDLITQQDNVPSEIAKYLRVLSNAPATIQDRAASRVELLTDRLSTRDLRAFEDEDFMRWSAIIDRAKSVAPKDHLSASTKALAYALAHPALPVSSLIASSFPSVYRKVVELQKESDDSYLSVFLLPFSLFIDLDRPKTLRNELLDAFLTSSWPPARLWLALNAAGAAHKGLKKLSDTRAGYVYLDAMRRDLSRLTTAQAKAARAAIQKVL